ncbi:hypothetical protein [Amycolatopsis speibonae]|uniref:Uncharacterized protein n=1 Tax=Amycolatopsis speibonae TaxID=1450224 RepID=A0ABV7P821_9PSEU
MAEIRQVMPFLRKVPEAGAIFVGMARKFGGIRTAPDCSSEATERQRMRAVASDPYERVRQSFTATAVDNASR